MSRRDPVRYILETVDRFRDQRDGHDFRDHVESMLEDFPWQHVDQTTLRNALRLILAELPADEIAEMHRSAKFERDVILGCKEAA